MPTKKPIQILLLLVCIAVLGCKQNKNNITETLFELEGLALNNGEKWIVNEETHKGMMRIDSILKASTETTDVKTLGNALSKQTSYIIKNCDMKGDPHDQLHIVLVPILEEISELRDIGDSKAAAIRKKRLQFLVAKYFEFFKI
ncbi:hypothetical protein AB9K26_03930 [Psychroserpens sp. XS_ASV72]|uniref:hypothetical protein n=1 Tax=Psychroserpens sp. XS_ASV72 TaxID=3241293 RepID=UPI003517ECF4